jgi:drug/metabolite transporter (DMT)-like permease
MLTLLTWGVADFLARGVALRLGSLSTAFLVQALGVVVPAAALAVVMVGTGAPEVDWPRFLAYSVGTAGAIGVAYALYYTGLERGSVSIVSSVASAWLLVTVLVAAVAFNESVRWEQGVLVLVVIAGVLVISLPGRGTSQGPTGVGYGLTAMVFLGVGLAMWKPLTEAAGPYLAVLAVRSLASLVSLGYLRVRGAALAWPATRVGVALLLGAAFLDAIGFVAYNVGLERSSLVLTAPLAAAHPLGTIALALLIIHERPTLRQWVGIALTITGVMVLSAVSGG